MSFYVTKTVLVGPKWFWFDQIDLDLTIMIWLRPKWNGQVQIVILYQNESPFGPNQFILVVSKSLWSSPNQFGQTKTILDQPKLFWSHRRTWHKWLRGSLRLSLDQFGIISGKSNPSDVSVSYQWLFFAAFYSKTALASFFTRTYALGP